MCYLEGAESRFILGRIGVALLYFVPRENSRLGVVCAAWGWAEIQARWSHPSSVKIKTAVSFLSEANTHARQSVFLRSLSRASLAHSGYTFIRQARGSESQSPAIHGVVRVSIAGSMELRRQLSFERSDKTEGDFLPFGARCGVLCMASLRTDASWRREHSTAFWRGREREPLGFAVKTQCCGIDRSRSQGDVISV